LLLAAERLYGRHRCLVGGARAPAATARGRRSPRARGSWEGQGVSPAVSSCSLDAASARAPPPCRAGLERQERAASFRHHARWPQPVRRAQAARWARLRRDDIDMPAPPARWARRAPRHGW